MKVSLQDAAFSVYDQDNISGRILRGRRPYVHTNARFVRKHGIGRSGHSSGRPAPKGAVTQLSSPTNSVGFVPVRSAK